MNTSKLTNYEISLAVKNILKQKKWSVRTCCIKYNEFSLLMGNKENNMDKDFVQRIRGNKFNVVTKRVAALCDFLGVDLKKGVVRHSISSFEEEFLKFEKAIIKNPLLEAKAKKLLRNIIDIISCEEELKNEIY